MVKKEQKENPTLGWEYDFSAYNPFQSNFRVQIRIPHEISLQKTYFPIL